MARAPVIACVLAVLAAGCGGDEEMPAPAGGQEAAAPAATETAPVATETEQRAERPPERDEGRGAPDDGAEAQADRPPATAGGGDDDGANADAGEERGDGPRRRSSRAELRGFLESAKQTVREAVELIAASDPSVCRRYFTRRYAERVSGLRGDAAFARCERDIARSEGDLRMGAFGPSRLVNRRAFVKFNLEAGGRLTSQEWQLRYVDGHWLVDEG